MVAVRVALDTPNRALSVFGFAVLDWRYGIGAIIRRAGSLQALEAAARRGEWMDIIVRTARLKLSDAPRIHLRLIAALAVNDEPAIDSCIGICLRGRIDPATTLAMTTRLIAEERIAEAWQLLSCLEFPNGRRIIAVLRRLASKTDDPDIRKEIAARLDTLGVGVPGTRPQIVSLGEKSVHSQYEFPSSTHDADSAGKSFRLNILNPGRVPITHETDYRSRMEQFEQSLMQMKTPRVLQFDDVFVSRYGQIWQKDGTIIRSADRPLPEHWRSLPVYEIDEAVLSANQTKGFYHWYAERLPALAWRLQPDMPALPILFGDHAAQFQDETLRLLGVPHDQIRRIGEVAYCRRVYIAEFPLASLSKWSHVESLYDRLATASEAQYPATCQPTRIYISRRDTRRRRLANEDEIEQALRRLGVTIMLFSEMSLAAQISAIRHADLVIAPHGAGLSHILNHKPGLAILEIHPVRQGAHHLRLTFVRLSRLRGHNHTLWLEPVNPATQEWSADVAGVVRTAALMIEDTDRH